VLLPVISTRISVTWYDFIYDVRKTNKIFYSDARYDT